jgi:Tol biopolymer transport system component
MWVLDFVSHRLTPITQFKTVAQVDGPGHSLSLSSPVFSSDSAFVAFVADQDVTQATEAVGALNIWMAPRDGSTAAIPLTRDTIDALATGECERNFAFSPDGSQIAFLSTNSVAGDPATVYANLWTVATDGASTPVRLTSYTSNSFEGITTNKSMAWSPKGDSIAFFAASNSTDAGLGVQNLQSIAVSSRVVSPLTTYAGVVSFTTLAWDSAAAHLYFESNGDATGELNGDQNVHVIDADGDNDTVAILGHFPELSPDGSQILYEATVGTRSGIWRVGTGAGAVGAAITSDTNGGAGYFLIEDDDD